MGHSDYRTTSIYADYAPDPSQGAHYAAKAFGSLGATPPAQPPEPPTDLPAYHQDPRLPMANIRSHGG